MPRSLLPPCLGALFSLCVITIVVIRNGANTCLPLSSRRLLGHLITAAAEPPTRSPAGVLRAWSFRGPRLLSGVSGSRVGRLTWTHGLGWGPPLGHRAPHCSDSRCLMRLWGAEQSRTFGPRTEPGSQEIRTEPSNSECSFIIKTNLIH